MKDVLHHCVIVGVDSLTDLSEGDVVVWVEVEDLFIHERVHEVNGGSELGIELLTSEGSSIVVVQVEVTKDGFFSKLNHLQGSVSLVVTTSLKLLVPGIPGTVTSLTDRLVDLLRHLVLKRDVVSEVSVMSRVNVPVPELTILTMDVLFTIVLLVQ